MSTPSRSTFWINWPLIFAFLFFVGLFAGGISLAARSAEGTKAGKSVAYLSHVAHNNGVAGARVALTSPEGKTAAWRLNVAVTEQAFNITGINERQCEGIKGYFAADPSRVQLAPVVMDGHAVEKPADILAIRCNATEHRLTLTVQGVE